MAGQSFIKRWFLRVALVAFGAVIALTFKFLYTKSHKPARTYQTETASKQDIVKKTVATGAIVPRQEVEIKPRVSGVIEELYVEPNTLVKTGQKIAKIKIVPNASSLNQAESSQRSAKIALDNAKRELDRNQALFEKGVIPEAELARFKTEYALRKQDYDSAGQQLQIVREGQARGGGAASNAIVTSTVDGMVIDVPIKVGFSVIESMACGTPVIATRRGSMPELVQHGVNGALVDAPDDAVDALETVDRLDRAEVRASVERRFDVSRMVDEYIEVYRRIVERGPTRGR